MTITSSAPGGFSATLIAGGSATPIESGFLPGGSTKVRVFLPASVPPGSTLVLSVRNAAGCSKSFSWSL